MHGEDAPQRHSWRTHCTACGEKKAKVWGPGRTTLAKHCPNQACYQHGLPQLFAVKTIVTFDRLGRRHTAHKEFTVRRRPQFTAPAGNRPVSGEGT